MTEQKDQFENQEPTTGAGTVQIQEDSYPAEDIEKGKTMAGLSYLIFFPLLVEKRLRNQVCKFHNQALLLLITAIAGNVILGIIPVIGWMLMPIFESGILVLGIIGLINGFGGKAKRLPLIGKFTILK